jgi:hypothetical protein
MRLDALLLAALVAAPPLWAQTKAAQVSALEGKAQRSRAGGSRSDLRVGAAVGQGDILETGEGARLEIRFSDASVLRLGPAAKLQLSEAHFGAGRAARKLSVRLFLGKLWAKVTSAIHGEQKFQVETENAVAGVRGTTFRVDANADKSVLVRVYDGTVAVAPGTPAAGRREGERREVPGPQEVTREQWEKLVGRQMQIFISSDGTPGDPEPFSPDVDQDDPFARWNLQRDAAPK